MQYMDNTEYCKIKLQGRTKVERGGIRNAAP